MNNSLSPDYFQGMKGVKGLCGKFFCFLFSFRFLLFSFSFLYGDSAALGYIKVYIVPSQVLTLVEFAVSSSNQRLVTTLFSV